MPEAALMNNEMDYERIGAERRSSIASGSQFVRDDSPSDRAYTGAWVIGILRSQASQEVPVTFICLVTPTVNQESPEGLRIDWPRKRDPFTQTDLLDSAKEQVQDLILRIRTSLSISYRESLANRLVELFNDANEEDSESPGISAGSLLNFHNFLRSYPNLKCPAVSLTPDYNIYASWRSEQGRLFSVHFLPNEDVRFVIFKQNDRHPEQLIRISGTTTTDILMETVAAHGVWDWISDGS